MSSGSVSKHETGGSIRRLLPGLLEASRSPHARGEGEPPSRQAAKRGDFSEKATGLDLSSPNPLFSWRLRGFAAWRLPSFSRARGPRGTEGVPRTSRVRGSRTESQPSAHKYFVRLNSLTLFAAGASVRRRARRRLRERQIQLARFGDRARAMTTPRPRCSATATTPAAAGAARPASAGARRAAARARAAIPRAPRRAARARNVVHPHREPRQGRGGDADRLQGGGTRRRELHVALPVRQDRLPARAHVADDAVRGDVRLTPSTCTSRARASTTRASSRRRRGPIRARAARSVVDGHHQRRVGADRPAQVVR